jgi:hypothetical protein
MMSNGTRAPEVMLPNWTGNAGVVITGEQAIIGPLTGINVRLDKERPAQVISSDVPMSTAEQKSFSLRPKLMAWDAGL